MSVIRPLLVISLLVFVYQVRSVDVAIDTSIKYQVIEGFGAAIAYYEGWLTAHPNKAEIYNVIFADLSLDILRYRNYYYYDNVSISDQIEIYQQGTKSLGYPPALMISSWSPPPELKSNNNVDGGTLAKNSSGQFVYPQFGQYWYDSLNRFRKQGLNFTYISIQNEPDMNATYDSCYFYPNEQNGYPSYAKALNAVYQSLLNFPNRPKILGPEVLGIGYNEPENFLAAMNLSQIDGIDHHLYHGGDSSNPDTFQSTLQQLQTAYPNFKKYQTEYYLGDWLQTTWLMHETLTVENAVSYLYWSLIWGDSGGLVTLNNPWDPSSWPNPKGYEINAQYYGVKHISAFVNPGSIRVSTTTTSSNLRVSGYLSSNGNSLSVVVINVNKGATDSIVLNIKNWGTISSGNIYQSTASALNCSLIGKYSQGQTLTLPAYSVTTLVVTK